MNLCSDNHDEVCYEGRYCPACIILADLDTAEATVKEQRDVIKSLQATIDELDAQLASIPPQ